jgi:bifunctional enzyme CysN/CysC
MEKFDYRVPGKDQIDKDLSSYLKKHEQKEMLRILVAGSVDDGKSTLIGRLLYDSHLIYRDHIEAVYNDSRIYNTTDYDIDLSLLTDGLKAEREQGITIDVAYRYFSTEKKSFIICDAPGHEQYTRNMATGASHCDMALILIDARNGVKDQTRRHSLIATIMGIRNIVVVVNKMDLAGFSQEVFDSIRSDYLAFSGKLNIDTLQFIPISALSGENVVTPGNAMNWFLGGPLLNYLENVQVTRERNLTDFRFPVQYVMRSGPSLRGYAGSIASGIIRKGDEIAVLPSLRHTKIKSIETCNGSLDEAFAPMPVVLATEDEMDISRGCVLAKPNNIPLTARLFEAMMVWMDDTPLKKGSEYLLKGNTQSVPAVIKNIRYKYNMDQLTRLSAEELSLNDTGRIEIVLQHPLIFDSFRRNKAMGSFILIDRNSNATSGAGIILDQIAEDINEQQESSSKEMNIHREESLVTAEQRNTLSGHKPLTIWLTGLSGSGKSTIAKILESSLLKKNVQAFILDGDNLRHGLNSDLGFSPEERRENIRRAAEVAKLMNDAGIVVIAAFISPYKKNRELAARIIGDKFLEVFVDADLETCKKRDPKGLYAKSGAGRLSGLTGVDAPYEKPEKPSLHLRTGEERAEESAGKVLRIVLERIIHKRK